MSGAAFRSNLKAIGVGRWSPLELELECQRSFFFRLSMMVFFLSWLVIVEAMFMFNVQWAMSLSSNTSLSHRFIDLGHVLLCSNAFQNLELVFDLVSRDSVSVRLERLELST